MGRPDEIQKALADISRMSYEKPSSLSYDYYENPTQLNYYMNSSAYAHQVFGQMLHAKATYDNIQSSGENMSSEEIEQITEPLNFRMDSDNYLNRYDINDPRNQAIVQSVKDMGFDKVKKLIENPDRLRSLEMEELQMRYDASLKGFTLDDFNGKLNNDAAKTLETLNQSIQPPQSADASHELKEGLCKLIASKQASDVVNNSEGPWQPGELVSVYMDGKYAASEMYSRANPNSPENAALGRAINSMGPVNMKKLLSSPDPLNSPELEQLTMNYRTELSKPANDRIAAAEAPQKFPENIEKLKFQLQYSGKAAQENLAKLSSKIKGGKGELTEMDQFRFDAMLNGAEATDRLLAGLAADPKKTVNDIVQDPADLEMVMMGRIAGSDYLCGRIAAEAPEAVKLGAGEGAKLIRETDMFKNIIDRAKDMRIGDMINTLGTGVESSSMIDFNEQLNAKLNEAPKPEQAKAPESMAAIEGRIAGSTPAGKVEKLKTSLETAGKALQDDMNSLMEKIANGTEPLTAENQFRIEAMMKGVESASHIRQSLTGDPVKALQDLAKNPAELENVMLGKVSTQLGTPANAANVGGTEMFRSAVSAAGKLDISGITKMVEAKPAELTPLANQAEAAAKLAPKPEPVKAPVI